MMVNPHGFVPFLTGPRVVEQVTRERTSAESLGGPRVHAANGVAHLVAEDDDAAATLLRELLLYIPSTFGGSPPLVPPWLRRRAVPTIMSRAALVRYMTYETS